MLRLRAVRARVTCPQVMTERQGGKEWYTQGDIDKCLAQAVCMDLNAPTQARGPGASCGAPPRCAPGLCLYRGADLQPGVRTRRRWRPAWW